MHDSDIEGLLKKYRPAAPSIGLEARVLPSPHLPVVRATTERTWPWAVAAAALLALTVGLHAFTLSAPAPADDAPDTRRVQALAEEIGGPNARAMAEYIVRREQRADAEARPAGSTDASPEAMVR